MTIMEQVFEEIAFDVGDGGAWRGLGHDRRHLRPREAGGGGRRRGPRTVRPVSERRLALVTGASRHRSDVRLLPRRTRFRLAIAARREDRLEALRAELTEGHGIDV